MILLKTCSYLTRSVYISASLQNTFLNSIPRTPYHHSSRFSSIDNNSYTINKQIDEVETQSCDEDRKLKYIQLEMSLLRELGRRMPDSNLIKKHHWDELLTMETKSSRLKFYTFLFRLEMTKENQLHKKQLRQKLREQSQTLQTTQEDPHINYSLNGISFLRRVSGGTMNLWRGNRLRQAMQFGEKLIFDCSYDEHMNLREAKNAAKQLAYCFAENRKNKEPFDLHFCNINFNGDTMKQLERYIPTIRNKEFPLNIHEGSYLDLFPKEQLLYLTPHCQDSLIEYDPDTVCIIGAMVDKQNQQPLSLGKAKKLNLRMARLPLDLYLDWGAGSSKYLTLDQMTKIMLDFKRTKSWEFALRNVPKRKVKSNTDTTIKHSI